MIEVAGRCPVTRCVARTRSKDDGVIQRRRLLQCDVRAQGVAQPGDEELDLLGLSEGDVAAGKGDEAFAKLVDGPVPVHRSIADSPIGLFMRGGPKWVFSNWTNCGHIGRPPLSSM
jgi:hypothetical protein